MPLSSRLNWKKIGYSDFAALYPIFPYHGERWQRIILSKVTLLSRHIWLRSANSTETDLRVAATSSAVPTATVCWSFDRPLSLASTDHAGHRIIMSTFEKTTSAKIFLMSTFEKANQK